MRRRRQGWRLEQLGPLLTTELPMLTPLFADPVTAPPDDCSFAVLPTVPNSLAGEVGERRRMGGPSLRGGH